MGTRLGVGLPTGGLWSTAENVFAVATLAEELGYASVWTSQRVLYPTAPVDPFPFKPDSPWPAIYRNALDPLVSLAAVAARTSTVRLGVGAVVAPFHSPLVLAKQAATLDLLSGGRFDLGVVPGWSRDEFAASGQSFAERGPVTDEVLAALKAVLTRDEVVRFAGERFTIPDSIFEPKPVQSPSIPVLIGGYGDAMVRRIAQYGDGYLATRLPLEHWRPLIDRVSTRVADAGRNPSVLRFVCRCAVRLHEKPLAQRDFLEGDAAQIRGDLARYEDAGVTDLVLEPNLDEDLTVHAPSAEAAGKRAEVVLRALAPETEPS
jgi:probable F420-dependent oxidoreductase